jgi:hypothetical protein
MSFGLKIEVILPGSRLDHASELKKRGKLENLPTYGFDVIGIHVELLQLGTGLDAFECI